MDASEFVVGIIIRLKGDRLGSKDQSARQRGLRQARLECAASTGVYKLVSGMRRLSLDPELSIQ